jgi:hypothetical protein
MSKSMEKTITAYAYFPIECCFGEKHEHEDGAGGPPPDDSTTVYLVETIDDADMYHWEFTLTDLVQDFIEGAQTPSDGSINPSHAVPLGLLRDGLRNLADQIDAAIARPKTSISPAAEP